jgi:hypothetical protein
MNQFDWYINGTLADPPSNWQALELEASFENGSPDAVLNATKLTWKGKWAAYLYSIYTSGNIFAAPSLLITVCGTQDVVCNGLIDLTDAGVVLECDSVTVKIVNQQVDLFNDLVQSIDFSTLAALPSTTPGYINPKEQGAGGDFISVRYQQNDIPDATSVMQAVLLMYNIVQQANDISSAIENIVGALTNADPLALGWEIAYIVVEVIYILFLVSLIAAEVQAIAGLLIPPVRHKLAMNVYTLCERVCAYFGFGFSSTILSSPQFASLTWMPIKMAWPDNETTLQILFPGFTSNPQGVEFDDVVNRQKTGLAYGYPDENPSDFFRYLEDVFNARTKIILNSSGQSVMHFERWDFQYNLSTLHLPNWSSQVPFTNRPNPISTNASEANSNYEVDWAVDTQDYNTLSAYNGTSCVCVTTAPNIVTASNGISNTRLVNLEEIDFQFAQAKRKDSLLVTEQIVNDIVSPVVAIANWPIVNVIQPILSTINHVTGSNFSVQTIPWSGYSTTLGVMQLSSDMTSTPKLFLVEPGPADSITSVNWHVAANNRGDTNATVPNMSANSLMKYFHFSSLPLTVGPPSYAFTAPAVPGQPYFDLWVKYTNVKIPMCCADYLTVLNNNYVFDYSGAAGLVDSLRWNAYKGEATIDYRVRTNFAPGLTTQFTIDGATIVSSLP